MNAVIFLSLVAKATIRSLVLPFYYAVTSLCYSHSGNVFAVSSTYQVIYQGVAYVQI